jgi:hypothetical protein
MEAAAQIAAACRDKADGIGHDDRNFARLGWIARLTEAIVMPGIVEVTVVREKPA